MEKNNELVKYEKSIFSKIKSFLLKVFKRDKKQSSKENDSFRQTQIENVFFDDKLANEIQEKNRILQLKLLYDKGQLDPDDISNEDVDKIIALYEEETETLNRDTKRRLEIYEEKMKNAKKNT